jgi:hypothetical protein
MHRYGRRAIIWSRVRYLLKVKKDQEPDLDPKVQESGIRIQIKMFLVRSTESSVDVIDALCNKCEMRKCSLFNFLP